MRRFVALVVALAGLLGRSEGAAAQAPAAVGEVVFVRHEVLGTPPGAAAALALAVGDDLVLRHQVETRRDSGARMTLGADGSLALGAETRIVLDEVVLAQARAGRSRLSLLIGTLRLKVGALFAGELAIDTPTAVVGIKGTALRVDADSRGTTVTVFEGTVTVLGKLSGKTVEVRAGRTTRVEGERPPTRPRKSDPALDVDPAAGPAATAPGGPSGGPGIPPAGGPGRSPGPTPGGPGRPPGPGQPPPAGQQPQPPGRPPSQTQPPGTPPPRPGEPSSSGPHITSCAGRAQAGEAVCLCGSFPGESARSLTVDGRPLEVVTATSVKAWVRLPEDLPAGDHVLAGDPRAGFARTDRCRVGVLVVESEYKEHLKQGRATQLILRVLGTTERVAIRLQNLSPGILRVKGGPDQVLTTRGGRNNWVRVRVKAIGDGRAHLRHQVQGLASCPCGAGPG
jgi:hypothetical protein